MKSKIYNDFLKNKERMLSLLMLQLGGLGQKPVSSSNSHLGAAFRVFMVSWKDFERDGNSVSSTVGTEGIPNCTMHSIIYHIQTSQSNKGHGPTTKLRWKLPLGTCHHRFSIMDPPRKQQKNNIMVYLVDTIQM